MDDHRFDDLTRVLGSGLTRRSALRSALGGLTAVVAGAVALSSAEAKPGNGKQAKTQAKRKKGNQRVLAQTVTNSCPDGSKNAVCHCPPGQGGANCHINCVGTAGGHANHEYDCMCSGSIAGVPNCADEGRACPDTLTPDAACGGSIQPPETCVGAPCSKPEDCRFENTSGTECECPGAGALTETERYCQAKTPPPETCSATECGQALASGGTDPCRQFSDCVCNTTSGKCETKKPPCSHSCEGKKCAERNECGELCGCHQSGAICVIPDHKDAKDSYCKVPPVCVPNGQSGICCSGYHRNGICCDPNDEGAVAIVVSVEVANAITVNTPPTTVLTTITPAITNTNTSNNSSTNTNTSSNTNTNSSKSKSKSSSKSKSRGRGRRRRRHHHGHHRHHGHK